MNEQEVLDLLEERGAVRSGHFKLSSGLHSDTYVQCALALQWPGTAERFGHDLAQRFATDRIEAVVAPAMGGVIIGHEVARSLKVRMVFPERVDGEMRLRRGFTLEPSERVLIVEDVVTTGRSPREAGAVCEANRAEVVGVAAIVDRRRDPALGVRFEALTSVHAETWPPEACPLCARGEPVDAPGSRHLGSPSSRT